jgi:protein phosphatase
VRFAKLTDVGVKRSHNQDACAAKPASDPAGFAAAGHVFIVADGMGGHAVGEKASAKAVQDIPLTYLKHVATDGVREALRRAFQEANASIYAIGQNNPEFKGLGTTGTCLVLRPEGAWVAHVGDSRCYRVRDGRVQQLTFDHSWVWEVAKRQGIDPDTLGDFKRNVIIRSLGPDDSVEVDVEGPHPLRSGDRFLMCSDGLSNVVPNDELGAVATLFPPEDACRHLVNLANLRGGPDNITCLVVQVPAGGPDSTTTTLRPIRGKGFPWPYLALGAGLLLIAAAVVLKDDKGLAGGLFGLATVSIFAGLFGFYQSLKRPTGGEVVVNEDGTQAELNLYRDQPFAVNRELYDRFTDLESQLRAATAEKPLTLDAAAHGRLTADAEAAAGRGDWASAVTARFRSLMMMGAAYHKQRGKDEGFNPKTN